MYIYKGVSRRLEQIPELRRDALLIPPAIICRSGWTHGSFAPVRQDALTDDDILPVHCFCQDGRVAEGRSTIEYLDEYGNPLQRRIEPCKLFAVGADGTIERDVADALGLPYKERWLE